MTTQAELRRKYSVEQIQFILKARLNHAMEYREIAKAFQKKFGGSRTAEQMRHAYRSYAENAVVDEKGAVEPHPLNEFTHASFDAIRKASGKEKGRWFVTAVTPVSTLSTIKKKHGHEYGHNLYVPGFKAVQTWMKERDAELVLLPMRAHMPALHGQPSYYDPRLHEHQDSFANEFHFNDMLRALDVHLNPQQIHPLTGLHRIRGGKPQVIVDGEVVPTRFNQSLIFAHAKQDMECVATGNGTLARVMYSTGAISLPEYLPNRIGRIASEGHVLGGLIVEVDEDKFWVRQVQFAADGSFCDIDGKRYRPDGRVSPVKAKALRMGDLHAGRENADVIASQVRLADVNEPSELFVEDVFDGASVSHHTEKTRLSRAMRPSKFLSIAEELNYGAALLATLKSKFEAKLVVVSSNHHEHLVRYLEEGRYLKDDPNYAIAHRMISEILDHNEVAKRDGVAFHIDIPLRSRLDPGGDFEWLDPEQDYYVDGVQMGSHGHLGVDGARGSPIDLEKTFGDGMIGHLHAPRIMGRLMVVGHASMPRHGYNRGPSRWLNTCGVVWPGGQKQLVNIIDGRYGLDDIAFT